MTTPDEYWKLVRQMLDHENNLINQRFSWLLAAQSLLFAALGVFWGKDLIVELIISLVGLISPLSVWYSLIIANRAVKNLVVDWRQYERSHDTHSLPHIYGLKRDWPQIGLPWLLIPPVISAAWFAVLIRIWVVWE